MLTSGFFLNGSRTDFKVILTPLISGAGVLGFEVLGQKLFSPFWGEGLDVWSVLLANVMLGLALGYFISGWVISRISPSRLIGWLLMSVTVVISLLPGLSEWIMPGLSNLVYPGGLILAGFALIFPVTFGLGMISPALVQLMVNAGASPGKASGKIFAISTLGGVGAVLLVAFGLLPWLGLRMSCYALATSLGSVSIFWIIDWKKKRTFWGFVAILFPLGFIVYHTINTPADGPILFRETGHQGELIVADIPLKTSFGEYPRRLLLNNRIGQTNIHPETGVSLWDYSHYVSTLAGVKPPDSQALLLGLAGGTIAKELLDLGYRVDAVDLDPRMVKVARKYFFLDDRTQIVIDDARHYLNTTSKTYDLILIDLFAGDGFPEHVLSLEAMNKIRLRLNPEGMLLVNFHGFIQGVKGEGGLAVYKTLVEAGFQPQFCPTPGAENERNIIFIGGVDQRPVFHLGKLRQNSCCIQRPVPNPPDIFQISPSALEGILPLTDDRPRLQELNREVYLSWREYALEHYLLELKDKGIPVF